MPGTDPLAPIDFIVVQSPDGVVTSGGFDQLLDLADRGVIRVLDVEFLVKDTHGARVTTLADLPQADGVDVATWQSASSGLIDADDLEVVSAQMPDDSVALLVIYENCWVLGLVDQWS